MILIPQNGEAGTSLTCDFQGAVSEEVSGCDEPENGC